MSFGLASRVSGDRIFAFLSRFGAIGHGDHINTKIIYSVD